MKLQLALAVAATLLAGTAPGETYPSRPIRIIPGQPGGGGYIQMLVVKDLLASRLGQPIVLENRSANLMGGIVARAQPDGYTLMAAGDTVWFAPLLGKTDYDTLKDFAPVLGLANAPNILVVHPSLPVNSVKELIAMAKSRPGALNYSSSGTGSSYHLAGELFKSIAGVNIVSVPYAGGAGPTIQAVLGGEVQLSFCPSATVLQFIKVGKLKALAHTGAKPTPLVPDIPTVATAGLPGYEYMTVNALFAPVKTPSSIIRRLNQEFVRILAQEDVKQKFLNVGAEANPGTPDELAAVLKSRYAMVAKLIESAGITTSN